MFCYIVPIEAFSRSKYTNPSSGPFCGFDIATPMATMTAAGGGAGAPGGDPPKPPGMRTFNFFLGDSDDDDDDEDDRIDDLLNLSCASGFMQWGYVVMCVYSQVCPLRIYT